MQGGVKRDLAVVAAFAVADYEVAFARGGAYVVEVKGDDLGDPQPGVEAGQGDRLVSGRGLPGCS